MIETQTQFENTLAKQQVLQQLYERKRNEAGAPHVRELTLRSIKHRINRFTEELARFSAQRVETRNH